MLKYVDAKVVMAEIPDEITLAINISNCPCHCKGCHSSYLAGDIGEPLTITRIEKLLEENKGVTAICFMGGDNEPEAINHYAGLIRQMVVRTLEQEGTLARDIDIPQKGIHVKKGSPFKVYGHTKTPIKIGWYSGRQELSEAIDLQNFDYIKLGPYKEECGPLNSRTTNQRFYAVVRNPDGGADKNLPVYLEDVTYKFWKGV